MKLSVRTLKTFKQNESAERYILYQKVAMYTSILGEKRNPFSEEQRNYRYIWIWVADDEQAASNCRWGKSVERLILCLGKMANIICCTTTEAHNSLW
ncbi:hypothetical protein AVEN_10123-1 [Araneus ventricosus]|uniref:Uncharacterized protein n=1 Tax=Araneus ventricosus TaxID=182803 RepID=A0A4Y2HEE5_ARAVE|nr:hypothetical protein AVEN_10123-1 [Araneus ventricosus]